MLDTIQRLGGPDSVIVIREGEDAGTAQSRLRQSSSAPFEGRSVVVGKRIADGIVGDGRSVVGGQQISPVGVSVDLSVAL